MQKKWWSLGGFSCLKAVRERPELPGQPALRADFLDSMAIVKDFWAEPTYASLLQAMQKRFHDYVVADKGTAKEALDGLVEDWTEVFKDDGKIVSSSSRSPPRAASMRGAETSGPCR